MQNRKATEERYKNGVLTVHTVLASPADLSRGQCMRECARSRLHRMCLRVR